MIKELFLALLILIILALIAGLIVFTIVIIKRIEKKPCCKPDGSCELMTATDCKTANGNMSDKSTCEDAVCPQPNKYPCCKSDGTCEMLTSDDCAATNGVSETNKTSCDDAQCKKPGTYFWYLPGYNYTSKDTNDICTGQHATVKPFKDASTKAQVASYGDITNSKNNNSYWIWGLNQAGTGYNACRDYPKPGCGTVKPTDRYQAGCVGILPDNIQECKGATNNTTKTVCYIKQGSSIVKKN